MEFIIDSIKMLNYKKIILFLLFLFFIIYCFCYLNNKIDDKMEETKEIVFREEESVISTFSDEVIVDEFIFVDVKGAVKNPGVYKLEKGSRVIDAINVSGGLLKNANTMYMNLSKILIDSDIIKVYTNDEIEEAFKEEKVEIIEPCICEEVICDIDNDEQNNDKNVNSKININTASVQELDTLNGIGEAKAKAIFEYRNSNGNFSKIEDIMNVSGISETLFEKIKAFITV